MITKLIDAKKALAALGDLDQEMGTLAPQAKIPELVALGQRLWWIVKKANKALDAIKERLRVEAGGTTSRFESGDGSHCMVVCPVPKVALRKEADILRLKTALGHKFGDLFEEVVQHKPRKDFQDQVRNCTPDEMQAVLEAVDLVSDTPRVAFKD